VRIPRGQSVWTARLVDEPAGSPQSTILSELRRVILDGDAPPGSTVPVEEVAEAFAVSRIPVREALKTLVGEGLVTQRPHAGFVVARLTRDELAEFYAIRGALEAAMLPAAVAQARPEHDADAVRAHARLDQAVRDGDTRGHHRESRRFHFALLEPSRMDRMLHMLESAWNMTEPLQPMAHAGPAEGALFHDDHQAMLAAFLARDTDALLACATAHQAHLTGLIAGLPQGTGLFADEHAEG
jgi:DNA-binding GntR family transcriptional regulator